MKPNPRTPRSACDSHEIHDQAKRQAEALREAAVGDFWRGADAMLVSTCVGARRSAERLRHALARRFARKGLVTSLEG